MKRKKKRQSILSRLEREIANFLRYYRGAGAPPSFLEKGITERKVEFFKLPKGKLRPKAVALIRQILIKSLTEKLN